MVDPATANVAYDRRRGEPRSARRQGAGGDCIDCGICVEVCPTGIDIRDGLQYQCINCGLCIDACDQVMDRIGAPLGLIRFASEHELAGAPAPQGLGGRPRVAVYGALLLVFSMLGVGYLAERSLLLVDVLRDHGALLRETAEGRIENAYTLKLMNLDDAPRQYRIAVSGLPGLQIVGAEQFAVEPGSIRPVAVTVVAPGAATPSGIQPIAFEIAAVEDPATRVREKSSFVLP
jgi:cytochrome c oxidase accessory protein FixG